VTDEAAARTARIAIAIQFLALVRTLGEVWRLRYVRGPALRLDDVLPYVTGGIIAAVFCWIGVTLYFFQRTRAVIAVAVLMVGTMLAYKAYTIGPG
jgi:hypothetical protein